MALNIKTQAPQPKSEPKQAETKGKVSEPKTNGTSLSTVLSAIRKTKGDQVVVTGNTIPIVQRLPTGVFEFDFYIGGGFPKGRYTIVYGPESSNKTNICLKAVAAAQRQPETCNKAVWVDLEHSFDPMWAEKMGVDTGKLIVVQPGYGEEAVDLVDALVRAEDVAILVVDSMAALIANKEKEQSVEKFDIGTSALLIKRMVNKLMVAFSDCQKVGHNPCVILINQTRFKPGVVYGDPETMPGGEAQKFLSSLRVRLYAKNIVEKATNTVVKKETHVVVKKAKVPVRAASFDFSLCVAECEGLKIGDTDSFNMVKSHLQALGLLTAEKSKGYAINMGKAKLMFPTLSSIQDKYYSDEEFRAALKQLVLDNVEEKFVFVAETSGPADVPPGQIEPVQSIAGEE